MNEIEKIDFNKLEAKDGVLTIIRRKDHPLVVHEEQKVISKGTIKAPGNYHEIRKNQDPYDRTKVFFSYESRFIILETRENHPLGSYIEGYLKVNPLIEKIGINTNRIFSVADLTKHLRFNSFFFASKQEHGTTIKNLQSFKARVEQEITKINDQRGNIEDTYRATMNSNVELNFTVKTPVFIGEPDKTFKVEIACEAKNKSIEFWLESPELVELLESDTKMIIDSEPKRFSPEIVILQQ